MMKKALYFLEAKKSCPNVAKRYENEKKSEKFEEYYTSIVEKFVNSLQVYVAAILNRDQMLLTWERNYKK